jgi:hypothetical protein
MPVATLLLTLPPLFVMRQRREKALLKIIETEAPQLFKKLKDEGIA